MAASVSAGGDVVAYGASDDCLEFEGAISDEWCDPEHPIWVELHGPNHTWATPEGLVVVATWTDAGTWAMGIAPLDEGVALPDWPVRFRMGSQGTEPGYSAVLVITIPAGTTYSGVNE